MKSEFETIKMLKQKVGAPASGIVGIGDDAAILPFKKGKSIVFATDVIVEGVDFVFSKASAEEIGRKALAVNLSDLAAMGAEPKAFVLSLGVPKKVGDRWINQFYKGVLRLAKKYKISCVGGDFSRAPSLFINIAVLGEGTKKRLRQRNAANVGDWIGVTGKLGGSLRGKHIQFSPRIREGAFLASKHYANAMIDISDGFVQDLGHILDASAKGAQVNLDHIPISKDAFLQSRGNKKLALRGALTDGEDFELCFTASSPSKRKLDKIWQKKFPRVPLSWVGRVVKKKGIEWQREGKEISFSLGRKKGFQHF